MKLIYNGQPLKTALPSFGEGLTFLNDELSVQYPTIPITKAEFDALTDEQKQGILYIVTDAEVPKQFYSGMAIYSEEETLIGTYNGKPLYRKVVSGTIPTQANTWSTFASNAIGSVGIVDQLTLCMGVFYQTENTCIPMPNKLSDTHWIGIYYDKGDDRIGIVCGSGYATGAPGIVILEYTKTTDPEGTVTPLPANCVQSYDTEDGWHVRKYADGYVEMTHISGFSVEKSVFHDWGSAVSYDDLIAPLDLPVPLLDKFYESGSIMRSVPNSLIVIPRNTAADIDRAKTSGYGVFNMDRSGLSDQISGTFSILVTGRWK